jgi:hypothetical protein
MQLVLNKHSDRSELKTSIERISGVIYTRL